MTRYWIKRTIEFKMADGSTKKEILYHGKGMTLTVENTKEFMLEYGMSEKTALKRMQWFKNCCIQDSICLIKFN